VLSAVFRGKFVDGLRRLFRSGKLNFHGALRPLSNPNLFCRFLRQLFRNKWVVYAKRPFGGPEHVLQYLARYTHRVAISNHRLISFEGGMVTFRWKDYAHHNKKRRMTVTSHEFLRRFLVHLLPRGFVRIRHFGFLANRTRRALVPICRQLLRHSGPPSPKTPSPAAFWRCPQCGGEMVLTETLTAQQIRLRTADRDSFIDSS
jgi:hypothetical protein